MAVLNFLDSIFNDPGAFIFLAIPSIQCPLAIEEPNMFDYNE